MDILTKIKLGLSTLDGGVSHPQTLTPNPLSKLFYRIQTENPGKSSKRITFIAFALIRFTKFLSVRMSGM